MQKTNTQLRTFSLQGTSPVRGPVVYRRQTLCCFNTNTESHKSALSHSSQSHMDGKESRIFFTSRFISTHFWPNWAQASFQNICVNLLGPVWHLQRWTCRGEPAAAVSCLSPLGVSPFGFPALEKSEKSRNSLHIFSLKRPSDTQLLLAQRACILASAESLTGQPAHSYSWWTIPAEPIWTEGSLWVFIL